jgi:preprotein translocase subunit SecG
MRRLVSTTLFALTALLLLAPVALAHDGGQGLYGATNDKVVTNAGFILIIFFPTLALLLSLLQWRLDKRKKEKPATKRARQLSAEWRGGW